MGGLNNTLHTDILLSHSGTSWTGTNGPFKISIPLWVLDSKKRDAMGRLQCAAWFKENEREKKNRSSPPRMGN